MSSIQLFDTYEKGLEDVKSGASNVLLVTNDYHGINNFYMDDDIELLATFIQNTPSYGIAVRDDFDIDYIQNKKQLEIASHPAPIKKLDNYTDGIFQDKVFDIKLFTSTSAATKSLKDNKFDFCLTNEEAIDISNLKFISNLTNISMVWSIFGSVDMLASFALIKTI